MEKYVCYNAVSDTRLTMAVPMVYLAEMGRVGSSGKTWKPLEVLSPYGDPDKNIGDTYTVDYEDIFDTKTEAMAWVNERFKFLLKLTENQLDLLKLAKEGLNEILKG